ncbi:hypothetical protein NOZE110980_14020 [Nocardioides zeicaulis]
MVVAGVVLGAVTACGGRAVEPVTTDAAVEVGLGETLGAVALDLYPRRTGRPVTDPGVPCSGAEGLRPSARGFPWCGALRTVHRGGLT